MTALVDALNDGRSPHLVGGTGELMEMLRGVQELKQGTPSTVPEFFGFQNWNEVEEFSKTQEGEHLTTFVNLVDSRGERQLMWALGRSVEEKDANIILSTAHKSKGREWDNVRLMDDFLKSRPEKSDDPLERERRDKDFAAELRLFYVAMTRARKAIDIPEPVAEMLGIKLTAGSPEIRIGRH
jgi:superfamily I DNA/RNA helicase